MGMEAGPVRLPLCEMAEKNKAVLEGRHWSGPDC